ncbi:hypothetical protein [Thermodesulfitimonas autotrophica]|nr:hypothetical protein [Thermodesulfitimonas autotrophica]
MADRIELLGWLKLSEPAFSDWDNPEDAAYDRIEERLKEGYLALAESHKTDADLFLPAQAEVVLRDGS